MPLPEWRKLLPVLAAVMLPVMPGIAADLKPGDAFPEIGSFSLEGKLPEVKGRVVLVDFWASWCGPCKQSFPALAELHKRYAERGLVVIGVSVDEKAADMERFLKKNPVPFVTVRDGAQKLAETVNAKAMPTSFLVDREGKVRVIHTGFHKGDEKKLAEEIESLLKTSP